AAPAVDAPVQPPPVVTRELPAAAPVAPRPAPVVAASVIAPPAPAEAVVEVAPVVPPRVEEEHTDIDDLPVWPQIPAHLFQQLKGGIRLDVHVYSDRPQDRFVLINLQKYRVGDRLQEGPLLDEITPTGVILSFQGQQFMVRAQ
ncbi:MAG: general secretion pathway protein GspB, partial [Thiogranum sp.]